MIKKILTYYAGRLDEYLALTHHQPEGLAAVGLIGNTGDEKRGKIIISLVGLEKEASGDAGMYVAYGGGYTGRVAPLLLNMNIMLAAVYDEKHYAYSLSILSDTLSFIQSVPSFEMDGSRYTVEVVPMSTMDLHNIWTTMGGQYYPSVICKLRGVVISAVGITASGSMARETKINM